MTIPPEVADVLRVVLDVLAVLAVPLLVLLNGFFVSAEFALVTIRWTRVEALVDSGRFGALSVRQAVEHLDDSIAATQLGITFASLALGWVGEPAFAHLIEPLFRHLPWPLSAAVTHGIAVGIAFLGITFLHVVLGELAPKAIALERAEDVALVVSGPLLTFDRIFRPFIRSMNNAGNWVVRSLRLPPVSSHHNVHSVDELAMLVEETQEAGAIPDDQARYVQNVFELSDKTVADIMVPSDRVVTISISASEEEVLQICRQTAHTRMPVWEGDPFHVVGVVNTKDLFHLFSLKGLVILMDAMYEPLYVAPDMPVARLLRRFRRERRQMAVVRDERLMFLGIVTLEDIMEEIVGEIEDEHDPQTTQPPEGA
ncbi:MAG: HlyC/CorC family transporter [Candidatus Eisenbacteria bacterium]|uniref:HlyC/CorC family transporter n=1 Tax=Eiseniibacteriota bacterium TaxID=2212470 RepID=A0A849SNS0_UNCEI|nr:HlyC/CorC family transporter [Candidatus Eisenbacteria bacterium]